MLAKIKHALELAKTYALRLRDIRTVGLLIFMAILFLVCWSGVKAIQTNYGLQKQISKLDQQNAVQRLANENLKLQNSYYRSPQYLELAARQDFGLAAPGETVLVVPKQVALAHTVALPGDAHVAGAHTEKPRSFVQRNLQAWLDFFLHRNQNQE